jgi:hypothetical protein
VKEPVLLEILKAYAPALATREGQWLRLESSPVLVWQVSFEFVYSTGALLFDDGKTLTELRASRKGFHRRRSHGATGARQLSFVHAGGVGCAPRLYDIQEKKLLYRSDSAVAVMFWPY